jgi:transcription antitermination factor NusG
MQTLNLYLIKPQQERKAVKELRQAGHRAYLPRQRKDGLKSIRFEPTARGYLPAEGKPYDAQHVGRRLGTITRDEARRLYVRSAKTQRTYPFKRGDHVTIRKGLNADVPAIVTQVLRGGRYEVAVTMLGKSCRVSVREVDMLHIHPGIK